MTPETKARVESFVIRRKELLDDLARHPKGLLWCARNTEVCDELVRVLYEDVVSHWPDLPPLAIIATGGYGRSELAPYSDLDLTIVPSDEASPELDAAIRMLFQDIHWAFCTALRLDVGYAYRLVSDAPGLDAKTRTGLLDMRLIAGSPELFRSLEEALLESFQAGEFIQAKIEEREEMFLRFNDTPLVVEPHLKEGAGGLRCFHCANWLREAIGERPARPSAEYETINLYRNLLHLKAGKPQDLFTRQRQAEVADLLQVDPYTMMAEVAEAGLGLHRWYHRAEEALHESRFQLAPGVLSVRGEVRLAGQPGAAEAAVGIAIATRLGLRVADLPVVAGPVLDGPAALYALSRGESTLRNLDRCGILKQMLPELDACRTLYPRDSVHSFTVWEHTMRVVRFLDSIEPGTFLGDVRASLNDLEPLYMAALLHDVGKARPEQHHAVVGGDITREIGRRWKLADGVVDAAAWLVEEHLTMAHTMRVRDLLHSKTIEEFAAIVGDVDRLGMLSLLTWADVNAVASSAWTQSQDTFLRELYRRTAAFLQGESSGTPDPAVSRQRLLRQLRGKAEDETNVQKFVESLPAYYLTTTPPDLVRLHLDFAEKAIQGQPTVELYQRNDLGATEVTVCALDAPGLLSRMLGVLYAFELNVGGIRACTTMTSPAVALDVFTVSFGGRPVPHATAKQMTTAIMDVLEGKRTTRDLLRQRGKDPDRKQEIFQYAFVPGSPAILELKTARGRGMPYRFSRLIADQGWNIVAARVGQWAGNAAAAFYISGPQGKVLSKEDVDRAMVETELADITEG